MKRDWENKLENESVMYASRFIVSWVKMGGPITSYGSNRLFDEWIDSFDWLSDNDKEKIKFLADNDKIELKASAGLFLMEHKKEVEKDES
jgi:hypothetical protein